MNWNSSEIKYGSRSILKNLKDLSHTVPTQRQRMKLYQTESKIFFLEISFFLHAKSPELNVKCQNFEKKQVLILISLNKSWKFYYPKFHSIFRFLWLAWVWFNQCQILPLPSNFSFSNNSKFLEQYFAHFKVDLITIQWLSYYFIHSPTPKSSRRHRQYFF